MSARRYATFDLILHGGKAPPWLVSRMKKLGKAILTVIVEEFGHKDLLTRLADPMWFQALSYVLGYDWNSSGVTTVVTGVLREILSPDLGILVAGGKGKRSLEAPNDIVKIGEIFGFTDSKVLRLIRSSRLIAKVDNALVQDGHTIYHHAMFIDKHGDWIVIQQGMNPDMKTARRYHWCSYGLKSFVIEPHKGICGDLKLPFVLNMVSRNSLEGQKVAVDLVNEGVNQIKNDLNLLFRYANKVADLTSFLSEEEERVISVDMEKLARYEREGLVKLAILRRKVNWKALKQAYEISPKSYEELVEIRGIGPRTVRALALIAELIYNAEISWKDPLRYTFAVGGKDRVPYPVNVKRMEKVAEFLMQAIEEAKIGKKDKIKALKRLSKLVPVRY